MGANYTITDMSEDEIDKFSKALYEEMIKNNSPASVFYGNKSNNELEALKNEMRYELSRIIFFDQFSGDEWRNFCTKYGGGMNSKYELLVHLYAYDTEPHTDYRIIAEDYELVEE